MGSTFKVAWRNLWRNRTRTLITGSAISLSFGMLLASFGLADDMYARMLEAARKSAGGSVLVHHQGYWDSRGSELVIREPGPVLEAARKIPGVRAAIPRVVIQGLGSSPRGSKGARLTGIDPSREAALQDMGRFLKEGRWLDAEERSPLVLGRALADDLELKLGDRVVLTATDPQGEMTRVLFKLTGVLETGSKAMDETAAYTTLAAAQRALGMGEAITQIGVVAAEDKHGLQPVLSALKAGLGPRSEELEVLTWRDAMPELVGAIETDKGFGYVFGVAIFVVVGFGIANTLLMSVLERIRELGLLSALGLTPGGVARLVLCETVVLAAVSIVAGLALGLCCHLYLDRVGIDATAFAGGSGMDVSGVILEDMLLHSTVDPVRWLGGAAGVLVIVVLSALYPAWRASRLDPVEAMRTYE